MLVLYIAVSLALSPRADAATTVSRLGPASDHRALEEVAAFGCEAVPHLARQLEATPSRRVRLDDGEPARRQLRLVWSIAALRYITGRDFYAPDIRVGEDAQTAGYQMLRTGAPAGKIKIFGVWMSRGMVYFASPDQQRQIIEQWRSYAASTRCPPAAQNPDIRFWLYGVDE